MIAHGDDTRSANLSINAANRQERGGKIARCARIDTIYFHPARAVYVLAIAQIDAHMCDAAAFRAEKHQISILGAFPVFR